MRSLASLILASSLCVATAVHAQYDTVKVDKKRLRTVVIGSGVAYAATMVGLNQLWYSQYPRQSFQFFNDADEWKQVDKVGHFYSAFQLSSIGSRMLQWSHVPKRKSDIYGTVAGFVVMSSIEVFDGFSAGYGASATDLIADACGAGLYLGENLIWNEVRIYPKFSFRTSPLAAESPATLGTGFSQLLKDYNGQTYWLSVDMDKFIPFPKWLNLCVGYGANNMIHAHDEDNVAAGYVPYRQFYFGIDFDLTAIHSRSKMVNSLIYFVNMIRIPAPALEFSTHGTKLGLGF